MINDFLNLTNTELLFLCIGFLDKEFLHLDLLFNGYTCQKKQESSIPVVFVFEYFWRYGLIYAIFRKDPVIITGQLFWDIYLFKKFNINL